MATSAKTTLPKPDTVPIDTSKPLTPTHALSIIHTKHHTILIQELTPHLPELFTATSNLSLEAGQKLIESTPAPPNLFTLKKENLLGTHLTVHDKEGKEVAEWRNPVLSLHAAKITIKFLDGEGEKAVEVIPVGNEKISESFTLNNTTYVWEAESKHHQYKHLYKIIENTTSAPNTEASSSNETPIPASITKKAREVARYAQKHGHGHGHHGKEGLLVIDSGEIEELVGVLTLCAMLEQVHKEERTDKIYDKVVGVAG